MKGKGKKLTVKQEKFVEYLPQCNWIGSEAVIKAGYKAKDSQSACEISSQLLKKNQVAEAVERIKERMLKNLRLESEDILKDRVTLARSDSRRFFNDDGTVKSPKVWDDDMAMSVVGFEVVETFLKGELTGYIKKLKLSDKNSAQHDLMDYKGLFPKAKTDVNVNFNTDIQVTNLELAAKILYILQSAMEKKAELENKGELNEEKEGD